MNPRPLVVLDACVLANFALCDTLLRYAESPRLFEPKGSQEIIRETRRTLESKLGWPQMLAVHFQAELSANFADALVDGYEHLLPEMTNNEKDRHVAAAAVQLQSRKYRYLQSQALPERTPCPFGEFGRYIIKPS
jgi:hypothetical protein